MSEPKKGFYYYSGTEENTEYEKVRRQKNNRMILKTVIVLFLIISALAVALGGGDMIRDESGTRHTPALKQYINRSNGELDSSNAPSGSEFEHLDVDIDISHDPFQAYYSEEPAIRKFGNMEFTITPVAKYKVSAMVASIKSYSDELAKVDPVDFALVWGKLAEPEYDKHISYSQDNRWYYYQYDSKSPFDNNFVTTHSANTHIAPANDNVSKAINTIKKRDKVSLSGFLVNLMGKDSSGRTFIIKTSTTRTDTGGGSCEIFYVTKVRLGNKVYE